MCCPLFPNWETLPHFSQLYLLEPDHPDYNTNNVNWI